MHASPKGWREPGSKRGRKRWKRETNGEESARGKKLEGAAGVEDGIDPYQTTLRPTTQGWLGYGRRGRGAVTSRMCERKEWKGLKLAE